MYIMLAKCAEKIFWNEIFFSVSCNYFMKIVKYLCKCLKIFKKNY